VERGLGGKGFVPRPFAEDNQFSSPWIHITSNVIGSQLCDVATLVVIIHKRKFGYNL